MGCNGLEAVYGVGKGIDVRELNTALQGALNPARPGEPAAERFGWRFQVRDKVIQTESDYKKEVFNGDIGTIERIDQRAKIKGFITIPAEAG
jgi:ATP-dependent exoDNAse (exonuclease V) alpha subunit